VYNFRVEELRKMSGLTQHELCVKYNIQLSSLRNIEKNRVLNVKIETLFKLKEAFGLDSIDDLFYIK